MHRQAYRMANGLSLLEITFHRSNLIRIDENEKIAHIFRNFFEISDSAKS
jgi:hypothetical protein